MPTIGVHQNLSMMITDEKGLSEWNEQKISPYLIRCNFLRGGPHFVFESRQVNGLGLRFDKNLTEKVYKNFMNICFDSQSEIELRKVGLAVRDPVDKMDYFRLEESGERGCLLWLTDDNLGQLDQQEINYRILKESST